MNAMRVVDRMDASPSVAPPLPGTRVRIFLIGQSVSVVGDGLATLAIPLLVLQVTSSPFAAALAAAPRTIGYLMAGLPGGVLVDRLNPRMVLLAADGLRLSVFLVLAVVAYIGVPGVWLILPLAFLAAGAGVFFDTAIAVFVRDLVPDRQLVKVISLLELANQAGLVVGPGIISVIASIFGTRTALLINALTFAVSLVTIFVVKPPSRLNRPPGRQIGAALRNMRADLLAGLRYIRTQRVILLITCLAAAVNFFVAAETLIVFYSRDVLHLSDSRTGVVVACGGLGGVLGAAVASRLVRLAREEVVIVCGIGGLGAALALFGAAGGLLPLAALNLLMTACTICAAVLIRALRQRVVPQELLGRVTATSRMIAFAANPVGAVLAGLITGADGGDPRPVFTVAGLLSVSLAATAWATGLRRPTPPLGGVGSL